MKRPSISKKTISEIEMYKAKLMDGYVGYGIA